MKKRAATSTEKIKNRGHRLYSLLFVPIALLTLYVMVPQLDQFDSAFTAVAAAEGIYIVLAGLCIVGAVASAAAVYLFLAQKPIHYYDSAVVQAAGMFVNRLLPAGIGGMGLAVDFLYRHKHSLGRATAIVTLNNVLTFFGHMLLLATVVMLGLVTPPDIDLPRVSFWVVLPIVISLSLAGAFLGKRYTHRLAVFVKDFLFTLALYRQQLGRVLCALGFAIGNTLGHVTALFLCTQAFHLDLSIAVALVALTGGVAVASVTPTPGGLFGAEAGLTAVLVSYDVAAGTALAVALSYRLVSYWLPLAPGAVAFWHAGRKGII